MAAVSHGLLLILCRYPWGQEAFDKAKRENKLIFLSGNRQPGVPYVPLRVSVSKRAAG